MRGKLYLDLARQNLSGGSEVYWRGAAGRAYYALMLECRDALFRWGFRPAPRDNVHTFVRLRFTFASDPDLKWIGLALDELGRLRNQADYDLSKLREFASSAAATNAVHKSQKAVDLLEAIDTAPTRQAAAVADIRIAFP